MTRLDPFEFLYCLYTAVLTVMGLYAGWALFDIWRAVPV